LLEKGTLSEFLKKKNYKLVAVEKDYLKLGTFESFKEMLPKAEFIQVNGQQFRIKKDAEGTSHCP